MTDVLGVNAQTGEVVELPNLELRTKNRTLLEKLSHQEHVIEDLEKELRIKRRQLSEARSERNHQRDLHPLAGQAREVFEHWRERLCPSAREFKDQRFDAVVARLNAGHDVAALKRAIDGCAARPYVTSNGRQPSGQKQERQAELELICRSEAHLQRFISYAEPDEPPQIRPRDPFTDLRGAFLASPGAGRWTARGANAYCRECAYERRDSVATLTPELRLLCEHGCPHEAQQTALLDWYRHSGMVRCPTCSGRWAA